MPHAKKPNFIYSQLMVKLPVPEKSFKGKTCIITGSNTGLGLEAARHIVRLGASKVIIAVRSIEKGEKAKASIEATTNCEPNVLEVWHLDLGSYASVQQFAERCIDELDRIDVLLENAAVASWTYSKTEDNETTLTVNVISTFLLAYLLLPKLKETASKHNVQPVISIVSSEVHFWPKFPERNAPKEEGKDIFEVINDPARANMQDRYALSKLLEVIMVNEMVYRGGSSYPVIINTLNPGFCLSELRREANIVQYVLFSIMEFLLARTQEQGSRTLVNAVESGPETHGEYLSDAVAVEAAKLVVDPNEKQMRERVYDEIIKKLEKIHPGVASNL